ncbi:MAG: hypothetical protein QXX80_05555 [Nitrososphaerota archaeon]
MLTKMIISASIPLSVSFASWLIGGEFLRILISSVLPSQIQEPVLTLTSYALTGLLLGAISGLVLFKLGAALIVHLAGLIAGWALAFALTSITSLGFLQLATGWAIGLTTYAAFDAALVKILAGGAAPRPPVQPTQARVQVVQQPQQPQPTPTAPPATPTPPAPREATPPTSSATVAPTPPAESRPPPQPAITPTPTQAAPPTAILPPIPQAVTPPPPPMEPMQSIDEVEEALLEVVAEEGLVEMVPLPNNTSPEGGSYPEVESRLRIDTTMFLKVVKRLADRNIIKVSGVEFKKVTCPHCQSALNVLSLRCRACGSTNIGRQRILQHEACGYLGPEDSFTVGGRIMCPRCGSAVKILRGPLEEEQEQVLKVHSSFFMCYDCNEVSPDPYISFRCLTCGIDYDLASFEFKTFYRYSINPEIVSGLQEQKKPLRMIAEELRRQGYEVQLGARIIGSSKVRHKVDLLYSRGGVTRGAIFLISDKGGPKIHEIMKIIVMKADTKIDSVKMLCMGQIDNDSKRLAELYNITIIENLAAKDIVTEVVPRLVGI